MARSLWKGLNVTKTREIENKKKIWFKNIKIKPENVGMEVLVYNGNRFINVLIEEKMVGQVIGTFILTKKIGGNIHKKKEKKRKK